MQSASDTLLRSIELAVEAERRIVATTKAVKETEAVAVAFVVGNAGSRSVPDYTRAPMDIGARTLLRCLARIADLSFRGFTFQAGTYQNRVGYFQSICEGYMYR